MHTWGIYNGRYGLSSTGRLNRISSEDRPAVDAMLAAELERQTALKAELGRSTETAAWIVDARLFQNYKLLQFCDQLAIYFNATHAEQRTEQKLPHVPVSRSRDVTVNVRPKSQNVYALSPFPFACDGAEFAFAGRPLSPGQHKQESGWSVVLPKAPTEWETFRLVAE